MTKVTLTTFALLSVLFFANGSENSASHSKQNDSESLNGTLQKMIVENASVTMQLDLNGLMGSNSLVARPVTLHFAAAPNSFFPILVFNDLLRGLQPGPMALALQNSSSARVNAPGYNNLPAVLRSSLKRLTVEKLRSGQGFDLAVRDSNTGFTFFNIEGHQYNYDAAARSFTITGGRLLISKQFASTSGIPSKAGSLAGTISIGAAMQPIEITQLANGQLQSSILPPGNALVPGGHVPAPGPDIVVGDLSAMVQAGSSGTQVGLGIGTTSCNNGDQPVHFFAIPNTDHSVISQNLYRMSGGPNNNDRFEQIGESWVKHTFGANQDDECNFGCIPWPDSTQLGVGCSDPYDANQGASYPLLGSRAWVNPFTGSFPSTARNHTGHTHTGTSHRVLVEMSDLDTTQNTGATYYAEAQYDTPQEYAWCQAHPGQCNMYNNASYRQFSVTGITNFTFSPIGATVRMQPATEAWTDSTSVTVEPEPGIDGRAFVVYKITNPSAGVWHYEYAIHNQNLDRSIQSFSVPLGTGVNISNIGFHAPSNHPGFANDGTVGNAGFSNVPWVPNQTPNALIWNCETLAQNPNANAIRFGTLYNFRFDADQPPETTDATVAFFKTGSPMMAAIQAPAGGATPTPTPTATVTPTATATATPRPTPSPRSSPLPRPRPTPPPRP